MTEAQPNPGHEPEDDYEDDELEVEGNDCCIPEEEGKQNASADKAG